MRWLGGIEQVLLRLCDLCVCRGCGGARLHNGQTRREGLKLIHILRALL